MKAFKTVLAILVMGGLIAAVFGCGAKSTDGTAGNQTATVKRGNLTLDITAAGNLALSHSEDLAVDLFYGQSGASGTKGTIGEVLVQEGDSVKEGQVLVTIDKSEWDDQMAALEDQVNNAERAILQAQISLKTAEQTVKNAKDMVTAKETAVLNAEISYQQTQTALAASITAVDYQAALAELRKAQTWYEYITTTYKSLTTTNPDDYLLILEQAEERLTIAQTNYDTVLSGYDNQEINLKKNQAEVAERTLAAVREDVNDANDDVTLKELSLALSQGSLQDSEKALDNAKKNLAEAQGMSPEIKAPFDGFITKVNVAGGDEVLNGAVAVTIADPNKFEADILVSEMDITQVKLGGQAMVTADAMTGMAFPAKVTHVAPTATIQSGVVNYTVKVELEEVTAISQNQTTPGTDNGTAGTLPPILQRAVDSGRMTKEQAEEFMKNGPPGGFTPSENFTAPEGFTLPEGTEFPAFSNGQATSQLPSTISQDFQLREGLTVTVSIIVTSRTNVLLVPNGAVTTEGLQSYAQVITASGETEKRAVKTGISDWQYTEITDGLSEGEQVSVTLNTSLTSTNQRQGGVFFNTGPR
jgi:multidrug efflux pump subunit AcrA (membrane-fusion protein)